MAKKLSTALRQEVMGLVPSITAATISGTEAGSIIANSANGLAIFRPGDKIIVSGAAQAGNNGLKTVVTVATNGSQITISEAVVTEGAGNSWTIALLNARAYRQIFKNAIFEIYSGPQPADADQIETGAKLVRITVSGGAVVPGVATNGLNFDAPVAGVLSKAAGETWSGTILATGVAGWFRLYTNLYETGAGATKVRLDGSVGTSNAQLNVSSLSMVLNASFTIDQFSLTCLE